MRKVRKNKFWIVLLVCFCGVIAVTAPLLAVTSMSGEDKSSSGISNSANLSNVKTILVEDKEDVVYNDNSIQYYNEYLPSTIIFYGNDSGGIKYLINSNLGVNALKYSDLYATVFFSDKDVQSSQESLGFTADDFIDVYFDYGFVTIVQKKLDVFTDFTVRIGYVHNKDVYVDVKVILSSSIIYGFDDNDADTPIYTVSDPYEDLKKSDGFDEVSLLLKTDITVIDFFEYRDKDVDHPLLVLYVYNPTSATLRNSTDNKVHIRIGGVNVDTSEVEWYKGWNTYKLEYLTSSADGKYVKYMVSLEDSKTINSLFSEFSPGSRYYDISEVKLVRVGDNTPSTYTVGYRYLFSDKDDSNHH